MLEFREKAPVVDLCAVSGLKKAGRLVQFFEIAQQKHIHRWMRCGILQGVNFIGAQRLSVMDRPW